MPNLLPVPVTPVNTGAPITSASLPGSALNAPVANIPGGGVNLPAPPPTQLNLQPFGAVSTPVNNMLAAMPSQSTGVSPAALAQALISSTTAPTSNVQTEGSTHGGESFISHVLDLLNVGTYSIAGAAEGGIDAKDKAENSHENFLEAALNTAMGTVSGFGHGIAGALGDSHPGDKDDWATVLLNHGQDAGILNGTQKTMPNYAENTANQVYNDAHGTHLPTNLTRAVTPDDIKKLAITNSVEGTAADVVLDPLNFMHLGSAIKGGLGTLKNLAGVTDDAKNAARVADPNNLENLLKDYKNVPADVGDLNVGQGEVPSNVQIPNTNSVSEATPPPGAMLGAQDAIQKGLEAKGAGLDISPTPELNEDAIPKTPPGLPSVSPDLNTAFKSGLQDQLAGSSDPAQMIQATGNTGQIDPDFFNQMLKDNMSTVSDESAPSVTPVAAPVQPTGNYGTMINKMTRDKVVTAAIKKVLSNGDGPQWATHVMSELSRTHGGMNGLEKTANFLDRMSTRLPDLRSSDLTKMRGALNKTMEADYLEHIASNKAVKAGDIINDVAKGDPIASAAAAPSKDARALSASELRVAQKVASKFHDQIVGSGHFPGLKNPDDYTAQVERGNTKKWSGPKQVNMFQTIANEVRKTSPGIPAAPLFSRSARILKAVEDHFQELGATPYSAAQKQYAIPLRLSDVLYKVNPAVLAKHADLLTSILRSAFGPAGEMDNLEVSRLAPDLKDAFDQAMQAAKAGSAISEAPTIKQGVDAGQALSDMATQSGKSDARIREAQTIAGKAAQDITRAAGGSDASVNVTKDVLKTLYTTGDKFETAVTKNHINSLAAMSKDILTPNTSSVQDINKALAKIIGGPNVATLGNLIGPRANAIGWSGSRIAGSYGLFGQGTQKLVDFFGTRFNPAYGNKDLRPAFVQAIASARALSSHDAGIYNRLMRQLATDPETLHAGMLAAQGHKPAVVGSDAEKWGKQFLQHAENLLGSTALKNSGLLSDTVAGRGQLLMSELNKAAKRFGLPGQFTNAKSVEDAMGKSHDLSKGADWLKSWQMWDIQNPTKFMMQLSNTVNHATREAKMFDEIGSRFGTIGKTSVEHPRLKGIHFDSDMAAQVNQFIKNLEDFKKPNSKFGRLADKVLSKYKTAATMYIPAHHVRAALGDVYLSWLAGNEDVANYSSALKVMKAQAGRYQAFDNTEELTGSDAVANAISRAAGTAPVAAPKGSDIILTLKNGMHVTADMIYTHMFQHGLLPTGNHIEDIPEEDAMAKMLAPFNGRVHAFVNQAAETREHFIRISHFVDSLKKAGARTSFSEAADKASTDVRKWHPDGTDLTNFERNVVRRIFPFYSWSRKAMPLIMESLLMRPTKISLYPRLMYAAGTATGALNPNTTTESDPFPTDSLFPNWLQDKGIGPLFGNAQSGYISVTPNIPSMDILEQLGGLTSGDQSDRANAWSSLLNPGIRIPEELLTGQTLGGSAIMTSKSGYGQYLLKQIPQVQQYSGITNITSTDPDQPSGTLNIDKLLNYLGAAGISQDDQYTKQAMDDYENSQRIKAGTGF